MAKASTSIREHNREVMSTLKPGELVEFPRRIMNGELGVYSHWAVYIGNGRVIHFAAPESDFGEELNWDQAIESVGHGDILGNCEVREGDFLKVAGDSEAIPHTVMNPPTGRASCTGHRTPYTGEEIVERARSRRGEAGYNLLTNNCEHFANWCRYGKSISYQVEKWLPWLKHKDLPRKT